jgi:hypothetical protein
MGFRRPDASGLGMTVQWDDEKNKAHTCHSGERSDEGIPGTESGTPGWDSVVPMPRDSE